MSALADRHGPFARTIRMRDAIRVAAILGVMASAIPQVAEARGGVGGMAEADATSLSGLGVEAPFGNPATLAWDRSLCIGAGSAAAQVQNDTYDWDDYRRWNGARWSEADKREILSRIQDDHVHGRFETGLHLPAVAYAGWAVTTRSVQAAVLDVPRDYAELVLFGNRLGQNLLLPASTGEGVSFLDVAVSHGRRLASFGSFDLAGGVNAHWLQGGEIYELLETHGSLVTSIDVLDGEIVATSRTADGGHGTAFDLGIALLSRESSPQADARSGSRSESSTDETGTEHPADRILDGVHGPYEVGLTVRNIAGSIRWSKDPRTHIDRAAADSLTLEGTGEGDLLETFSGSSRIGSFTRDLPLEVTTAVALWIAEARCEIDWTQGLGEGPLVTETARVALGTSFHHWSSVTPRAGLAIGGIDGPVLAGGLRLHFWRCSLDLAYQSLGSFHVFLPKGVGVGAALTIRP
ncbi:MAG: hypothetical protein KC729_14470 [Candidatus Eisenbacteria bacterium]|uniref:DUF5723 domain-containing protein n=1 Tax=Eiseniibacteriota bacterium TaxID=2212470 RepID=A0A956RQV5_UNCEI|nr:hypothetical protein [Candidatus Eisenbacteria bacterium]